jgi:hypothetical protein
LGSGRKGQMFTKRSREIEDFLRPAVFEFQLDFAKPSRPAVGFDLPVVEGELDLAVLVVDGENPSSHPRFEHGPQVALELFVEEWRQGRIVRGLEIWAAAVDRALPLAALEQADAAVFALLDRLNDFVIDLSDTQGKAVLVQLSLFSVEIYRTDYLGLIRLQTLQERQIGEIADAPCRHFEL